jgi:hypothetical protein
VLVTSHDILTVLKEDMVTTSKSKASCHYTNAKTADYVYISRAEFSPAAAKAAVASAANTAGVKVQNLPGVGDAGIAYVTTTTNGSVATCVIAKNGTVLFMYGSVKNTASPLLGMVALATTATDRI